MAIICAFVALNTLLITFQSGSGILKPVAVFAKTQQQKVALPQSLQSVVQSKRNHYNSLEEALDSEEGDAGRIVVESDKNIYANRLRSEGKPQEVVDSDDAWYDEKQFPFVLIGDHNSQGFCIISEVNPGDRMYIIKEGICTDYTCIDRFEGYNRRKCLTDMDDNNISQAVKEQGATHVTYTCQGTSKDVVHIALWK